MGRRRLRGDRSFKRLLKQMVPAIRSECQDALERFGKEMASVQRASGTFGNRTGSLRAGISYQVLKQSLKVKVGIIGKTLNRKLFYGRILEFGRKAGGRGITRKSPKYAAGVGMKRPDHFIYGHSQQQEAFKSSFNKYWDRVLSRASQGVGDD